MDEVGKVLLTIFGSILVLALASVIVGKNSQAPQVIDAGSTAIAKVVSAAVNPINKAGPYRDNNGANAFTLPGLDIGNVIQKFASGFHL